MRYKHKIPLHLEVQDHILFGLTARQVLLIGGGLVIGYLIWTDLMALLAGQWGLLLALVLALPPLGLGTAAAFLQPGYRGLEQWVLVWAVYLALPKRSLWNLLPQEGDALPAGRMADWLGGVLNVFVENEEQEEDEA